MKLLILLLSIPMISYAEQVICEISPHRDTNHQPRATDVIFSRSGVEFTGAKGFSLFIGADWYDEEKLYDWDRVLVNQVDLYSKKAKFATFSIRESYNGLQVFQLDLNLQRMAAPKVWIEEMKNKGFASANDQQLFYVKSDSCRKVSE